MATTDERLNSLEQQVSMIVAKIDMFILESQQQREDIRRLHERQDALQAEMRTRQDEMQAAMQAKQDEMQVKMTEMDKRLSEKIDSNQKEFAKQLHDNFIQTMIGVGAIMATIGGIIIAALK